MEARGCLSYDLLDEYQCSLANGSWSVLSHAQNGMRGYTCPANSKSADHVRRVMAFRTLHKVQLLSANESSNQYTGFLFFSLTEVAAIVSREN